MIGRKFGADIENLVKEKSSNHIVLKSRSFSFDGKTKAPSHITRRTSFAQQKPVPIQLNKTTIEASVIVQKSSEMLLSIQKDSQFVPEFLKDCIKHMRSKQMKGKISIQKLKQKNPQYLSRRGQLVDWMTGLHLQLRLFPQTLYIAVNYMDSFCSETTVKQSQFELMAASCILISGKFEETYQIPCIRSIQQFFDYPIQRQKIIQMEQRILEHLDFNLIFDAPLKYLELFSKLGNLSNKNFFIASYILELSLVESTFVEFSSSILGAAVSYLVNKIRKISPPWPTQFKELVGYDQSELKTCAKNLCSLLERSQSIQHGKNIRAKFSKPQFCSASNIRLQRKHQ